MSAHTKDGVTVKVGQVWKDLDLRMGGRTCVVTHVHDSLFGAAKPSAKMRRIDREPGARVVETSVRIDRMHKCSTGWALVSDVAE